MNPSRRIIALAVTFAAAVALGGMTIAQAAAGSAHAGDDTLPASSTTHIGCVQNGSGKLRVVDDVTKCRKSESAIEFGAAGPAAQQCPGGLFVNGFDANGNILCAEPVGGDQTGGSVDADTDGFSPPADCDDTDALVHPGAEEVLNGVDDDCDGSTDVVLVVIGTNLGQCTTGLMNALTGEVLDPGIQPSPEVPDGIDNDCDGITDEPA